MHRALLDIVAVMNAPNVDEEVVRAAGIPLDRALFPLLMHIERFGPIGIVDLADRVGRNYTTVSRQVAKLDDLGLVRRETNAKDRRMSVVIVSPKGQDMTDKVAVARENIGHRLMEDWQPEEVEQLVKLVTKFARGLRKLHDSSLSEE